MISPAEIDALSHDMVELYSEFSNSIVKDIARRIAKLDYATPSAALQVQRLSESGALYNHILEETAILTGRSEKELKSIFQKAGVRTMEFDDSIYRAAGLKPIGLNLSPAMQETLIAGLAKTGGTIKNLTMATALAGQEAYLKATDLIYMQVSSGTMSYTQAIREQVKKLAADGVRTVQYAKTTDQIDVAVRRAVLTGVGQTTGQLQMNRMEELNVDLVSVSAHIGARPAHQLWQGKVYSLKYPTPKYPGFVESTKYGSGDGLMGWNCRHTFFPFFEGISEEHYKAKELKEYADKKVVYNGKEVPFYDATQIQRGMERDIRFWKRQAEALDAAGLDNIPEIMRVKQAQAKLTNFVKQTGLVRQRSREGFRVFIRGKSAPIKKSVTSAPMPTAKQALEAKLRQNRYTLDEDKTIEKGFFDSARVKIEDDGHAIRKPNMDGFGVTDLSMREAIASDVDELLGIGLVPKTVYRPNDGASFQAFMPNATVGLKVKTPAKYNPVEFGKMEFLDKLIGNIDRHRGNFLISQDGHLVAIDHGLTFGSVDISLDRFGIKARNALHSFTDWQEYTVPLSSSFRKRLQEVLDDGSLEAILSVKYGGQAALAPSEIQSALERARRILADWATEYVEPI